MLDPARGSYGMMLRAFLVGVVLPLAFSLGNPASAAPTYDYVDIDPIYDWATQDTPLTGTFDITTGGIETDCFLWLCDAGGFDPDTQNVDSAVISFLFYDNDFDEYDVAIIDLGVDPLGTDPLNPLQDSITVEGHRFFLYLENIQAEMDVLVQLSNTGSIDWQVATAEGNDSLFVVASSLLASQGSASEGSVAHTPEPSAALLFCLGFGVVGTATRRRTNH
jgi:hypothetical protein